MRRPWFQTGLIAWQLVLVLGLSLAAEARSDRPRASTAPTERPEPELHKTLTEAPLLRVGQLLAHGANIEARDATGATPLITAAARGNITLIRLLLSRLARVDARDRDGDSALHLSSLAGCVDCVDALLQAGAPPDSRNTLGFTPLHQAVRRFWELPRPVRPRRAISAATSPSSGRASPGSRPRTACASWPPRRSLSCSTPARWRKAAPGATPAS